METSKLTAHPKVERHIVNLQMEHSLPVEIIRGKKNEEGEVEMTLNYELEDYGAYTWLVNKSVILASKEIQNEKD